MPLREVLLIRYSFLHISPLSISGITTTQSILTSAFSLCSAKIPSLGQNTDYCCVTSNT